MNIKEFQKKYDYKIKTIEKWLKKGYIRGAKINKKTGQWEIPKDARPPYTKRGKVGNIGIHRSIANGVFQKYDVFPELYGISEKEFNIYIQQMIDKEYIDLYKSDDGIVYYISTLKTKELIKMSDSKIKILFDCLLTIAKVCTSN